MEEKPHAKPIPLSIRQKSSSRIAAVQCMYRIKINSDISTPLELYDDYMAQWREDKTFVNRAMSYGAEPDKKLFITLLSGVIEHKEAIEHIIRTHLSDKWSLERVSKLIIAILECAIFEMQFLAKLPAPIVVNEYVTITARFFDENEIGFINGLLDGMAKEAVTSKQTKE